MAFLVVSGRFVAVAFTGGLLVSIAFLLSVLFRVSCVFFGVAACRQVKLSLLFLRVAEGIQTSHGAATASAAARGARTQGDRIASLFGQLRTLQIAACAAAVAVAGAFWLPSAAQVEGG
jgi:hypothetical protein